MSNANEVKEPLVVGEDYLVPCVHHRSFGLMPIIPFPHRDPEFDNPELHVHFDYRFISNDLKNLIMKKQSRFTIPVAINRSEPEYVYRYMKCVDAENRVDPCSLHHNNFIFVEGIDELCENKKMINSICPHKGYSLAGIQPDSDGVVTCPLHGARWNSDGSYNKRLIVGESLLVEYLKTTQTPEKKVCVRLYTNEIKVAPTVTLDDLVEIENYSPVHLNLIYELHPRPRVIADNQDVIFNLQRDTIISGYYLTVIGWHKPIWLEAFRDGCMFKPLISLDDGLLEITMN